MGRDATSPGPSMDLATLLEEARWLRGLASHLVGGGAEADDLVQETWMAALRSPPRPDRPPRPWLGQVLRNVWRMAVRGSSRRQAREHAAGAPGPTELSPEQVIDRGQQQRRLAELVMALEEPYRSAILLRYYQELPGPEIARALGVPAGTVRWRISEGLAQLRARLDQEHAGQRRRWTALLLPLAGPGAPGRTAAPPLSIVKVAALSAFGVSVVGVAVGLWPAPSRRAAPAAVASSPDERAQITLEQEESMTRAHAKLAAFLGVGLPALMAAAQDEKPLTREENIALCVEFRERTVVCKEELSHMFVSMVPASTPPEKKEKMRQKALKEIEEDGTGPLEPRRAKCAASVDRGLGFTQGDVKSGRACLDEKDCTKMVACIQPRFQAKHGKRQKK